MLSRGLLAVLVASFVAGPLLVAPRRVHACSCAWNYGVEGNVERAELVVVGTVQEIGGVGPLG